MITISSGWMAGGIALGTLLVTYYYLLMNNESNRMSNEEDDQTVAAISDNQSRLRQQESEELLLGHFERIRDAMRSGASLEAIAPLIEQNPHVLHTQDSFGRTLLHHAALVNPTVPRVSLEILRFMIQQGADVQAIDFRKDTPLHLACFFLPDLKVIQLLVDSSPSTVQKVNVSGETPLHIACGSDRALAAIQYLTHQWPLACLLLASRIHWKAPGTASRVGGGRGALSSSFVVEDLSTTPFSFSRESPLDIARSRDLPAPDVIDFLETMTERTEQALLEVAVNGSGAAAHFQSIITVQDLHELLDSSETRARLPRRWRSWMDGFSRMKRVGRVKAASGVATKQDGVAVLATVTDQLTCLWAHLRENPAICMRHTN